MSSFLEDEELFPLSFANPSSVQDSYSQELDSLINLAPPMLSESPDGSSESEDEISSYDEELLGSSLLYASERLTSRSAFTKNNYTYANEENTIFNFEDTETVPQDDLVIVPQKPRTIPALEDEFANAAQQNYRLWLSSF